MPIGEPAQPSTIGLIAAPQMVMPMVAMPMKMPFLCGNQLEPSMPRPMTA